MALTDAEGFEIGAGGKELLGNGAAVAAAGQAELWLEAVVVVGVAVLDARVGRVVCPVCDVEVVQAGEEGRTGTGKLAPGPRVLWGPDKVLDGGEIEVDKGGQAGLDPAEVVERGPVGEGEVVDVAAVGVGDCLLEVAPALLALAAVLPVAEAQVAYLGDVDGIAVEQLRHGVAGCHAAAQALEAPGGIVVEVVEDAGEDVCREAEQGTGLGWRWGRGCWSSWRRLCGCCCWTGSRARSRWWLGRRARAAGVVVRVERGRERDHVEEIEEAERHGGGHATGNRYAGALQREAAALESARVRW
jgi:hypothetical protein